MLKELFTSQARIKLLELFILNPNKEFYVRELTRILDEQINSIRRELENLSKIQFLKNKLKQRKKYYKLNHNTEKFKDLNPLILKNSDHLKRFIKACNKQGSLDLLLLSGVFINQESPFDIYLVGEIRQTELTDILKKFKLSEYKIHFVNTADFAELWGEKDIQTISIIQAEQNIKIYSNIDQFL